MPTPNRSAAPPAPAKTDRGNVGPLDSDPALAAEAATPHESAADGATSVAVGWHLREEVIGLPFDQPSRQ